MIYKVIDSEGLSVYCEGANAKVCATGELVIAEGGIARDTFAAGHWERCHHIETEKTLDEVIAHEDRVRREALAARWGINDVPPESDYRGRLHRLFDRVRGQG